MSVNYAITSNDPELQRLAHKTLCICTYGGGWGKWQTVIFGSVAQSSCIYDFWQCLDSSLTSQGIRDLSLWWDTVVLLLKGHSRQRGEGQFLVENKLWWWSIITHSAEFFPSLLQLPQYLPLLNVSAPKTAQLFIGIISYVLSFIALDPGPCSQYTEVKSTSS